MRKSTKDVPILNIFLRNLFIFLMKAVSFIVGLIILQASFGMYFSKHYCGGQFRYVSFFSEANCCDQADICFKVNTAEQEPQIIADGCCSNEHIYISSLKAEAKAGEKPNTKSVLVPEQGLCEASQHFFPREFISTATHTNRTEAGHQLKLPILFQTFLL